MTRVLFVCVGNAGRSQMAEAFAKAAGLDAHSAGTTPSRTISSRAVAAMKEIGIDISAQSPKPIDWDALHSFNRTITMGCGVAEACPTLHTDEDWELDDPVDLSLADVRLVRDQIAAKITALAAELGRTSTAPPK